MCNIPYNEFHSEVNNCQRTEINLHQSVMHGFHLIYFHKPQNNAMPLCEDMLYLISPKSVTKCGTFRQKFMHSLQ
jgi:hypothetical protein